MFLFSKKKQDLIEDVQKYLKIEDLDDLSKHYIFMRDKYGIKAIQKYTSEIKPPLEYQALVNILFHPDVVNPRVRLTIQKVAVKNEFGEYALLATVVGLQGLILEESTIDYFISRVFEYLQTMIADNRTDKFTLIVASRITNTLLCSKDNIVLSDENVKILLLILQDESYKSIHNNIILCILKFCPDYINETKCNTVAPPIYEKIIQLKKLQEKGKAGQLYCYIPNLNELTFGK